MKHTLIILTIFLCPYTYGQELFDSLNYSFSTSPKLTANFGTRNAFITNEHAKMRQVFIGLNYADITRIGVTFNWLANGYERDHMIVNESSTTIIPKKLRMYYFAPHIEYTFFRSKHWEAGIPVQLGVGWSYFTFNNNNKQYKVDRDWVMMYEPAMTIQYRFLKYFAIGGGAGYRLMLKNNKHMAERFTSPVYMVWFKIFFSDIYKQYQSNVENGR